MKNIITIIICIVYINTSSSYKFESGTVFVYNVNNYLHGGTIIKDTFIISNGYSTAENITQILLPYDGILTEFNAIINVDSPTTESVFIVRVNSQDTKLKLNITSSGSIGSGSYVKVKSKDLLSVFYTNNRDPTWSVLNYATISLVYQF